MNIAIEFGGSEFRSLERAENELLARRVTPEYLVVPGSDSRWDWVSRHAENFARCDKGLIVFGPSAGELSQLLELPLQSALDRGQLRTGDPISRQFLGTLVDTLLPRVEQPRLCGVIASRGETKVDQPEFDGLEFLVRLVRLRGYQPHTISPGLATILGECASSQFSGIAVKLGASQIDISVVHQTRERVSCVIPRGGWHLDRQLALRENSYRHLRDGREVLDLELIRAWRAAIGSLNHVRDPQELELRQQYRETIRLVLYRLRQELTPSVQRQLPAKLPLVITGSLAAPAGVENLFVQALTEISLPLEISSVRRAGDPAFSSLRGALVALEQNTWQPGRSAA